MIVELCIDDNDTVQFDCMSTSAGTFESILKEADTFASQCRYKMVLSVLCGTKIILSYRWLREHREYAKRWHVFRVYDPITDCCIDSIHNLKTSSKQSL